MKLDALAFGAHADDVELSCGGTITKLCRLGYKVGVCDLTAGELSTRGAPETRAAEASRAAEIMGCALRENLGMPDGNIVNDLKNRTRVIDVLRRHKPDVVFLPYWVCRHHDHIHASRLVAEAAFYSGLRKIETGREAWRPRVLVFYMMRHEFEPSFIVDISSEIETKLEAIRAHRSQFHDPESTEPETFISSRYFLDSIVGRNRYFGLRVGAQYAEPFLVREALRIDDPIGFFSGYDANRIMSTKSKAD